MKQRLQYLDVLRGVAVILVIFGHCLQSSFVNYPKLPVYYLIYSFHVPLFVFVSGYLLKFQLKKSTKHFINERFFRLFIPYLIWMTIRGFVYKDALVSINILQFITRGVLLPQTPWFLYTLFFSSCITFILIKSNSRLAHYIFIIFVFIINLLKFPFLDNAYLLSLILILHYSMIMYFGFIYYKNGKKLSNSFVLLSVSVLYVIAYYLSGTEFNNSFYQYPLKLFTTFSLIYIAFYFVKRFKFLSKNKYLSRFGRYALELYVIHYIFLVFIPYKNGSVTILLYSFIGVAMASIVTLYLLIKISRLSRSAKVIYEKIFGIVH